MSRTHSTLQQPRDMPCFLLHGLGLDSKQDPSNAESICDSNWPPEAPMPLHTGMRSLQPRLTYCYHR